MNNFALKKGVKTKVYSIIIKKLWLCAIAEHKTNQQQ